MHSWQTDADHAGDNGPRTVTCRLLCAGLRLKQLCHVLQQQLWQRCWVAAAAVWRDQHRAAVGREGHDTLVVVLIQQLVCTQEDQQLQDTQTRHKTQAVRSAESQGQCEMLKAAHVFNELICNEPRG